MRFVLVGIFLGIAALVAHAQVYKHVDERGRVTYSNSPMPGGKKLDLPPTTTIQMPKPQPQPEARERESAQRAEELRQRLAAEEQKLEQARQALREGEATPEVFRTPSGGIGRNVVKYEEKIKALQESVERQQKTVDALKQELESAPGGR